MSLFHRTLRDLLNEKTIDDDKARRILDEHLAAVNEEFQLDRKVIAELKEYYELLKQARELLGTSVTRVIRTSSHHNEFFELLRKANALVTDMENKIIKEYGAAHKFLK